MLTTCIHLCLYPTTCLHEGKIPMHAKKIGGKSGERHFLEGRACDTGLPCIQHAVITQTLEVVKVWEEGYHSNKGKFQCTIVGKKTTNTPTTYQ